MTTTANATLNEERCRASPDRCRPDRPRRTMTLLRVAVGAVALAAALTGVVVSPASADVRASTPIQYVTKYFWGGSTGFITTGTVSCPAGSRMVSSGASAAGGDGALTEISPVLPDHTAVKASGYAPGYLQVTIGCEPIAALSEVVSRTVELPAGKTGFQRGEVHCPAGMRAFGGGGTITRPFGVASGDSFGMVSNTISVDGTGWTFAAVIKNKGDHLLVTTQCAPFRGGGIVIPRAAPSNSSGGNVYAPCPPNYTALSGGVYMARLDGTEVRSGLVDYSVLASNNRWYASGSSYDTGTNTVVALVQCIIF